MPGSAPGERRGGRQKGTPNKATAAKRQAVDDALAQGFALLGPVALDGLTPAQAMLHAMRVLLHAGLPGPAMAIAEKAAPYFDAKKAATGDDDGRDIGGIVIHGGLPDDDRDTLADAASGTGGGIQDAGPEEGGEVRTPLGQD